MNLTVLSLCIAAAQTLIGVYVNNLMKKKMIDSAKQAEFACVHAIKGRRRYKSILLKDPVFANALKEKFESLDLFKKITVNTVTGTVLLEYECKAELVDEVIDHINEQTRKVNEDKFGDDESLLTKSVNGTVAASSAVAVGKGASKLGQSAGAKTVVGKCIGHYAGHANSAIRTALSGVADISIILGGICLIWGTYKVFVQKQTPNGPQLVWWGYKILEGVSK